MAAAPLSVAVRAVAKLAVAARLLPLCSVARSSVSIEARPERVASRPVAKPAVACRRLLFRVSAPPPRLASRATRSVPASTTVPPA
ncbi:Uncharacterised protein [Bordetella pertussis]|nr:Uncharacterised protein [Bordetella pertussis]